ncbi:dual specificity protein phosphatase family protein [Daeguia caeni]|uniref:Dual specificity protein phosphatase family protein n=1 Tax=Daeguia caeni TaxID=439612 RepID=A0ABV9H6A1_9HYPH|nr:MULTISPECIES: dual specificity protein phosphatase family protein [Brucella/Ochrobactrum group]
MNILRVKKLTQYSLIAMFCGVASVGGYAGYLQIGGNFHEVIPNELYRSAQLNESDLERKIKEYKIKTVVNLIGPRNDKWYRGEISAIKNQQINHIDFEMSSTKILPNEKAIKLVDILKNAEKPILIHCRSGSDRTGLASVIYLNRVSNLPEDVAERQLSIQYGHFGIPFLSPTYAMDETWEILETAFGIENS